MAKLSVKNIKQASPSWMVNTTGTLTGLIAALITMVNTMPAGVPEPIKDWLLWGINGVSLLAAVFAGVTIFAKSNVVGGRPDDRNNPKP